MTRVLIVDDSPTETYKMTDILSRHGYEVISAENGEEGVVLAEKEMPDIVLMDIVMPGMNGFQATRKISKNKATANIPVIIVTTKDQDTDRMWGERQGAKGYLTKPLDEKLLLSTIKTALVDG